MMGNGGCLLRGEPMKRWIVLIVTAMAIGTGCEREQAKPAVAPTPVAIASPTTAPAIAFAAAAPATQPAATEPVGTLITIDQRYVDFPQARLKLTTADQGMTALLYSVDPPTAILAQLKSSGVRGTALRTWDTGLREYRGPHRHDGDLPSKRHLPGSLGGTA